MIEQKADEIGRNTAIEGKKLKGVPRNALLKPSDAEHRLGNQHFSLGDRIVYVQDSGRVPIATRGTVVGISRTSRTVLLDIVFDVTFMSGTTLGDRCSPFRGSTVPASAVLNVTDKQVIAGSKAAATKKPMHNSQPLTVGGYGAPAGPNGRGQFQPASAPPPLRGSWRGAVSGPRGGGPGFRGGRGNLPIHSHPGPAQSFNNVPPPASLDGQRGRGRGRGGFRGDAGRGRGRGPFQQRGRGSPAVPQVQQS